MKIKSEKREDNIRTIGQINSTFSTLSIAFQITPFILSASVDCTKHLATLQIAIIIAGHPVSHSTKVNEENHNKKRMKINERESFQSVWLNWNTILIDQMNWIEFSFELACKCVKRKSRGKWKTFSIKKKLVISLHLPQPMNAYIRNRIVSPENVSTTRMYR